MNPIRSDRGVGLFWMALDGLAAQQSAIANNIANADTPGFQRQAVPFQEAMRQALARGGVGLQGTDAGHIGSRSASQGLQRFTPLMDTLASGKNDGNTVEIEREMTDLTENQLKFYAVGNAMSSKLGTIRDILTRAT